MPNKYYTLSCCGQETTQPQYSCHTCYPAEFELEINEDAHVNYYVELEQRAKETNIFNENDLDDLDDLPF